MTTRQSSLQGDELTQAGVNEDLVDEMISVALTGAYGVRVDPNDDGTITATDEDPEIAQLVLAWGGRGQIPFQYRRRV